jgi:uncharacterized protein (DUF2252 family)
MSHSSRQKSTPKPHQRAQRLEQARNLKMARSSHRYMRGATGQFYAWLAAKARPSLPAGPPIWICGDCHIGNLGPIANAAGRVEIQIRDLDQTTIGNPAHDLLRLSLSLASAARSSNLRGVTTALMLESVMDGYELAFAPDFDVEADLDAPEVIVRSLDASANASWKSLAERIGGGDPTIPLGKRFWPLSARERAALEQVCASEAMRRLATVLKGRPDDARVKLVDAAFWVKGCSSLGKLRYAAILRVGDEAANKRRYCIIDFKEADSTAAPAAPGATMPRDAAERVVAGARSLSPFLGARMIAAKLNGRPVFVRELRPQDLKLELDMLPAGEATDVAFYLGAIVGKAHSRQMSHKSRADWLKTLKGQSTRVLDAPTWLWSGVVDLLAEHERGYLDHCRRYALARVKREADQGR